MEYLCEVCQKVETLTEEQAYKSGWDYPPFIGVWGVISPRTCPDCPMTDTAYWAALSGLPLNENQMNTVLRIQAETLDMELSNLLDSD